MKLSRRQWEVLEAMATFEVLHASLLDGSEKSALRSLLRRALIERLDRGYYRITHAGRQALQGRAKEGR